MHFFERGYELQLMEKKHKIDDLMERKKYYKLFLIAIYYTYT